MKAKHVLASLGLTIMCGLGALIGLSHHNEAKVAKAESGDTWMFAAFFDASTIPAGYKDQCSNFRFHVWGTNVNETFTMHESGAEDLYTVNCAFNDEQTVTGAQFIFYQTGDQNCDKYSTDQTFSYSSTSEYFGHMSWQFKNDTSWPGGKWEATGQQFSRAMLYYYDEDDVYHTTDFETDPIHNRFIFRNIVVDETNLNKGFDLLVRGQWNDGYDCIFNTDMCSNGAGQWFKFAEEGTYDLIVHNECKIKNEYKGIIEIKRHSDADNRYIYYVLENNTPTNDYIYTWGGSEQFGAWPGTKITLVSGVQEVTNNGVFHFQGGDPKLIYKIPVTVGYPTGDDQFKFNNNDTMETAARPINGHSAYWWDGDPNGEAGYAIDFLVEAEAIRNAAADYSVCNISKEDAASLVSTYLSLGQYMQETYIDCTTVLTHKKDGTTGEELVLYRDVMEQLAEIAEMSLSSPKTAKVSLNSSTTLIVIVTVASISLSVGVFFIVRRRKHN